MKNTAAAIAEKMDDLCRVIDDKISEIVGERVGYTVIVWTSPRAIYGSNMEIANFVGGTEKMVNMWKTGNVGIPIDAIEDSIKNPADYGIEE